MSTLEEFEGFDILESDEGSGSETESEPIVSEVYHTWKVISEREYGPATIRECTVDAHAAKYYANNLDHLVHDLKHLRDITGATAINVKTRIVDIESHKETIRTLRIDTSDEALDSLPEYISSSMAPIFEGNDKFIGSDNVTGMIVIWNLQWVQLITQTDQEGIITTVVGTSTTFPGYLTKVIDVDNHGITYSESDCIFRCLNEALDMRLVPMAVRAMIYPEVDPSDLGRRFIRIKQDLKKIAKVYGCNITIHCIDDHLRVTTSTTLGIPTVHLVKMGSAIGIRDKVVDNQLIEYGDLSGGMAYYDLETVSEPNSTSVYGFSILWPNHSKVTLVHHDRDTMNRSIVSTLSKLLGSYPGERVYLNAWNGSRFDHLILLGICSTDFKVGYSVTNNRREILSVSLTQSGKSLILRDPCKMFPGTLQEIATLFGLEQGKLDIDHNTIEGTYLRGELEQYLLEHKQKVATYVERDVELLRQITEGIMQVYEGSGVKYHSCLTRNMASYSIWKVYMSKSAKEALKSVQFNYSESLDFPKGPVPMALVRASSIAGRVQAARGTYAHTTLVDFKSMYPSVATSELYPGGNYHGVLEYTPGKLGLYRVEITTQNHPYVIPYRDKPKDAYDWNYEGVITKIITNVDLECLYESGVTPKVIEGIVWDDKVDYFSGYMTKMFQLRGDASNNLVLSGHYKAMSNSLTGAIFQQLTREYSRVFKDLEDAQRYVKMHHKYIYVVHEVKLEGDQVMMYFYPKKLTKPEDIDAQREICKGAMGSKPVLLTMFIYAYARAKLWRMWKHIEGTGIGQVVYTDTDSLAVVANHISNGKLVNVSLRLKEHMGSSMGQLEIVFKNADMVVALPKVYAMRSKSKRERIRIKGVDAKGEILVLPKDHKTATMLQSLKNSQWIGIRDKYNELLNSGTSGANYEAVASLLNGYVIVAVCWYFIKESNKVNKQYAIRIIGI